MSLLQVYKEGNLIVIKDQNVMPFRSFGFSYNFVFYSADPNQEEVSLYSQQDARERSYKQRSYLDYRDGDNNGFASYDDLIIYLSNVLGLNDGSGFSQDVNIVSSIDLPIDDSIPINVNVENEKPLEVNILERSGVNNFLTVSDFQANLVENYAVFGIRSTISNYSILIKELSFLNETNDDCRWHITLNPTISRAVTWGNSDFYGVVPNTNLEFALLAGGGLGSTFITSLGNRIIGGNFLGNNFQLVNSQRKVTFVNALTDELWLGVFPITTGLDFYSTLNITENV